MAMANSVEWRYPFLDYRFIEFSAKLTPNLKMKVLDQKHLLKRAAGGLIPPSIQKRHKQPYRAPEGKSFFGATGSYIQEMLSPDRIQRDGVFQPQAVSALLAKFSSGRASSTRDNMALVSILSTEILIDQFIRQQPALGPANEITMLTGGCQI
jgi:asparagine synthase (glutamine-hydrolysing)